MSALTRYTKVRVKELQKQARKVPVLVAYVVEVQAFPKQKLWLFTRTSQGNRPSRLDLTKSLPFCEKFRTQEDAESAALTYTVAYPKYLHKVVVKEVRLVPSGFDWKIRR